MCTGATTLLPETSAGPRQRHQRRRSAAHGSSSSSALRAVSDNNSSDENVSDGGSGGSTVVAATFSLVKAILGCGALALPSGLAAISDAPNMLLPANVLLVSLGVVSAYTFSLYGRLAHMTGADTAADIWKRVTNRDSSKLLSVTNFVFCFGACLTLSIMIGDLVSSLVQASGVVGAESWLASRQTAILGLTTTVLWPLCNLSSLAALAPVSIVGVLGMVVVTVFLAVRCPALVPSSPYNTVVSQFDRGSKTSAFMQTLPPVLRPTFWTYNRMRSAAPLVLVSMACVAWMAHFSAPEFYRSLSPAPASTVEKTGSNNDGNDAAPARTDDEATLKKFTSVTVAGYLTVAVFNVLALSLGFLTFGGNSAGIILNNYATSDWGASLSRLLIIVSVVGGFPFLFGACRSAAVELFVRNGKDSMTRGDERNVTVVLLSIVTAVALVVKDAGFAVAFNGALMGSAITYIFPCFMFLKQTANASGLRMRVERWWCRGLIGFGAVSAVIGAVTAVLNSYFPYMLR